MSTVMHPVGPEGARVYWIRRVIVVAVAIGLVALVWAFLTRDGGAASSAGSPTSPASSKSASTPAANGACTAASLSVTLTPSAQSYAAGQTPSFTLTATNTSSVACTLTMGDASRQLAITSGSDRIFSSADCKATAPVKTPLLLLGTGQKSDVTITWNRSRSAEGCPSGLATPRSGTYKAVASLLGAKSEAVVFTLG